MSRHPIRLRLTAWYAGSTLALLLLCVALLHVAFRRTIAAEFDRNLASSLALTQRVFRLELGEYHTVLATVQHVASEALFQDRHIEFVRPDGSLVVSDSAAESSFTRALEPPVRTAEALLDARLAPGWRVRVRASAAGVERELHDIDFWLSLGIPTSILVAALAGWWLTGRTLRPVGEMAAAVERITEYDESARLPIADPNDELGRLGARFNALLVRLERALAQQRRFIGEAAHELRTPLARLLGRVELALLETNGSASNGHVPREALQAVHDDLQHTAALVDELLQLARVDAGQRATHRERLYLDDIVLGVVESFRPAAERKGVYLTLSRAEEAPALLDASLTRRMLDVLVDNAVRYTPSGGRIDVRVWREGARVVAEIEDSGVGIPDDERGHVFDRFFRGRDARRIAPDGSGLGLPIAVAAATLHGGTVELLPAATGGTVAHLSLPASS